MCEPELSSLQSSPESEGDAEELRVACYDKRLLTDVCQHISREVHDFAKECLSRESAKRFATRFEDLYKAVMQENTYVKEVSPESSKKQHMSQKRNSKVRIINENILPKLGELMVELVEKRKRYPRHCCQILHQSMKEERRQLRVQNTDQVPECPAFPHIEKNNEWLYARQKLADSFSKLSCYNKVVQTQICKVKLLEQDILVTQAIFEKEKQHISDIFSPKLYSDNREADYASDLLPVPSLLGKQLM